MPAGVQLRLKCHEIMEAQGYEESAGTAKITPGYNLPCRYVLHTVGPVIVGPLTEQDCEQLAGCYLSCLKLAAQNKVDSIAFCCISTGVFHFPQDRAARIAVKTVSDFLKQDDSVRRVIFDVFTDEDFALYQKLFGDKSSEIFSGPCYTETRRKKAVRIMIHRLSDRVADDILTMITIEKRFLPGEKLPNENRMAEELGSAGRR